MEEPKTAPEATKPAPEPEKVCSKANDLHTFVIALLTSIIVVGLYHFGMGAYRIYFPECEESYFCEEEVGGEAAGEQADEVRPPKEHIKGKKPGKPPKFDKDGKPRKFGKDGKPRKPGKGKKPAPGKADAPALEKAPEKADAPAPEKAPAEPAK